jgi:anti-anti-sigma regulatory factor
LKRTSEEEQVGNPPDVAWKMEPALEIWVDVETVPVNIRLTGALDGRTGRNVHSVVEQLLQEGYLDFVMEVDELDPPGAAGFSSLVGIQRLVKSVGGSLKWSLWAECGEQRQGLLGHSPR